MKKVLFVLSILFISLSSIESKAQGCGGGGTGEVIGVFGFIQPQWNYYINGDNQNKGEFTFNRARLGVQGAIPYDIEYYLVAELSGFKNAAQTVHLLDAYVSYTRFGKWAKITMGQFKTPFGLEQSSACHSLYTVNRSEFVNQLAGPQRDLGLLISGGHDSLGVSYSLGFMNGSGMNVTDDNTNKHVVARVVVNPFNNFLKVGASFRAGKINPTDPEEDFNDIYRLGADAQISYKNLLIQSEVIFGQDVLNSASRVPVYGGCGGIVGYETKTAGTYYKSGAMVMASYKTNFGIEPVVKFDTFDPDHVSVGVRKNYLTFGLNYYVNDYSRIQINYVTVQESVAVKNDMIMVQLQAKF